MSSKIHIYSNSPTAGGTDGTQVDSNTQGLTGSLVVKLNSSVAESKSIKMAVRTENGYYVDDDCVLTISGDNANKWSVLVNHDYDSLSSVDSYLNSTVWGSAATLTGVDSTNSIFWLKAISSTDESPTLSGGASLNFSGSVMASVTGG